MRIGVIGGGQLARMMIPAAINLGIELHVLAEQQGMSAGFAATRIGDYRDSDLVVDFARSVDAITFDHEHVPQQVLGALVSAGIPVHPGPRALLFAQNKLQMRRRLTELGLPVPEWRAVANSAELEEFLAAHGGRVVVKTPTGGYDGRGVRVVTSAKQVEDWFMAAGGTVPAAPLLAEELVSFRRELAQQVARRPSGELAVWPAVETVQLDGVCAEVVAPAPHSVGRLQEVAGEIAITIAEELNVTGVLTVELFETDDDRLVINELAMRPHNSGHWSLDAAVTSQFEQHLRAVLDLPLGDTGMLSPWAVMVNILGGPAQGALTDRYRSALAEHPGVKVHNYGKAPRPGRKVGHVTGTGDDLDEIGYHVRAVAASLLAETGGGLQD